MSIGQCIILFTHHILNKTEIKEDDICNNSNKFTKKIFARMFGFS